MKVVEIVTLTTDNPYDDDYEEVIFKIDGKEIGRGQYGGAPEDNNKCRDYRWVEEVIKKITIELGGQIKRSEIEGCFWDFISPKDEIHLTNS